MAHFDRPPATRPWGDREPLDDRVDLSPPVSPRTRFGTLVDVGTITTLAHEAGALVYLDSVHAGPHHTDRRASIGCDYLVASANKFLGRTPGSCSENSTG